jgi:prepilin-type N-terminal cleavage/methylation domain-containing protein
MAAMFNRTPRGVTLLELLLSLVLMGVLLGMAAVPVAWAGDVLAVRAARAALVNAAATARVLATRHGGATMVIHAASGTVSLETRDGVVVDTVARLGSAHGVRLEFDDAGLEAASIRFDGLGLGRLANRTVRVQRGAVAGGVTISAYGRVRAW